MSDVRYENHTENKLDDLLKWVIENVPPGHVHFIGKDVGKWHCLHTIEKE